MHIDCDKSILQQYTEKHQFQLHKLSFKDFRLWLKKQIENQQNDPVFMQRCKIRDLKKREAKTLQRLQKKIQKIQEQWNNSKNKKKIEEIERAIFQTNKAIEGIKKAIKNNLRGKKQEHKKKLQSFEKTIKELKQEEKLLLKETPEKTKLEKYKKELCDFEEKIGLPEHERALKLLFKKQSHRAENAGNQFENISEQLIRENFLPFIEKNYTIKEKNRAILSNVTLGCAKAELDHVIIAYDSIDKPVKVIGIVEEKRNINDIAKGFLQRQENIAWFTRDSKGYDPKEYRTKVFRKGEFDKTTYHKQNKIEYMFDHTSFNLFQRSSNGYFIDLLFFISNHRYLRGMNSGDYSKILYAISTDTNFNLRSIKYMKKIFEIFKKQIPPFQTLDVFQIYQSSEKWGKQILLKKRNKVFL